MPELPEVETIRSQLDKAITGLIIADIEVLRESSFAKASEDLDPIGKKVLGVGRRAKITIIELENGLSLAIHLKMTGQLIYRSDRREVVRDKNERVETFIRRLPDMRQVDVFGVTDNGRSKPYDVGELPNKYTRVIISFTDGSKLYFNDLRMFGWIKIIRSTTSIKSTTGTTSNDFNLDKYGPEAIDEETFTFEYFKNMLAKTSRAVKLAILDQEKLAGVGNIYANEALFRAGILPTKKASILGYEDIKILREEIIKVLREAIAKGGTSDNDEAFRQLDGQKGGFQQYLQVYNREGKPCPKCGEPINKMKVGGRGTYWCPGCQI